MLPDLGPAEAMGDEVVEALSRITTDRQGILLWLVDGSLDTAQVGDGKRPLGERPARVGDARSLPTFL